MTEEAYKAFIPAIELLLKGKKKGKVINAVMQAATNDDFRRALIDTAKNKKFDEDYRSVAVICLSCLAPNHDDALQALIDIANPDVKKGCSYNDRWWAVDGLADLAPTHENARVALREIAQDENDPLRQAAAAALQSLATQATIDPLAEQQQLLGQRIL